MQGIDENPYLEWARPLNVTEEYRGLSVDEIKAKLYEQSLPAAVCMYHTIRDMNLGGLIRSANAFGFREIFYVGRRSWDRRAAVGTHLYGKRTHTDTWSQFFDLAAEAGYVPVAIENNHNFDCVPLYDFEWPQNPVIIVGEEQAGLPEDVLQRCKHIVQIPQRGSVRSLNVSVATGICMSHYVGQWG